MGDVGETERSDDSATLGPHPAHSTPSSSPPPQAALPHSPAGSLHTMKGRSWHEPKALATTWPALQPFTLLSPQSRHRQQQRTEPSTGGAPVPHTAELGNPPPRYPNTFGQQERGSTAAHRKVISKSRSACSQAPGRLDPFLERGSSATNRNRQTLTSQVGDRRKGRPRAPHHTHPSERWRWVGAGLWDKPARAVLSLAGQHKCKRFCGTTVEENKAKLCKAWVGSGR